MQRTRNLLDLPILWLSKTDVLKFRDVIEGGTLVTGGLGAGKSSTTLRQYFLAFMRAHLGGLVCVVKSEETDAVLAYARECGREADVVLFNEQSGLTFDPLAYESSRTAERGRTNVETLVDYCSTLMNIGKHENAGNTEKFWTLAGEQAIRHSIRLHQLAGRLVSIVGINRAIESFPRRLGEHEEETWQLQSYTAQLINDIRLRKDELTADEWSDLDVATRFIFSRWASYDERPRGSIEMTVAGMADRFLFHPMNRIFSGGTFSFTPEQTTHEHKIIVVDFPVLQYGKETARLIQIAVKTAFMRAWMRHRYQEGCCNGAFLVQDEFQFLLSGQIEQHFVQVCRSSAIAMVCATQSIMGVAEALGEAQPGSRTKNYLNNLSIKIGHHSTCPDTNQFLADVIGKEYRYMDSFSAGGHTQGSVGGSQQLAYIVDPIEFTRLMKPDAQNPCAEAIVYQGGRVFSATKTERDTHGRNHLRVLFSREA